MNLEMINLVRLQLLDHRILKLTKNVEEGPDQLNAVTQELSTAEDRVKESLEREREMQKRRRELDSEVEDTDEKIRTNQTRQLKAKNNEEYRALLREDDFLRKSNSAREDELLQLMEDLEKLSEENNNLKIWLEEQQQQAVRRQEEIQVWINDSVKRKDTLNQERGGLLKDVPDNYLVLYHRIFNASRGRAVVPISNGICEHCRLQVPPQLFNELQRNESLLTCPNCQRIIYWADHDDYKSILSP